VKGEEKPQGKTLFDKKQPQLGAKLESNRSYRGWRFVVVVEEVAEVATEV
jgi:hypothetical protein